MSYIDGFVIAVPTANKDKFVAHAKAGDGMFMEWVGQVGELRAIMVRHAVQGRAQTKLARRGLKDQRSNVVVKMNVRGSITRNVCGWPLG